MAQAFYPLLNLRGDVLQVLVPPEEETAGYQERESIADRCGPEDSLQAEQVGKDQDRRDQEETLAAEDEQQRRLAAPDGLEE